jgi:hypothetical protein
MGIRKNPQSAWAFFFASNATGAKRVQSVSRDGMFADEGRVASEVQSMDR